MTAADLKHLHPNDVVLWLHVEAAVWRLAQAAQVKLSGVSPTPTKESHCNFGLCNFFTRGVPPVINITLRDGGRHVPMWRLIETIAHEVAHAKVGWRVDHGPKYTRAHGRLLLLAEKLKLRVDIQRSGVKIPS